ncbi:restriction endonuclease subunit S [Bauldia litoralis]|uniref:Type I restriction enzyme, S subunit n=1 Tax=Bauldia litoralis TaxID=665467 RepID=A0A1G6AJM4_9HYPH|nr:restriction endonuclease subunit S [Bauldia litoralis]SDB08621.1 type I restriction enzyme, S subunit [Bauldia litoralis]
MNWSTNTLGSVAILDRQSVHPYEADAETSYLGLEHLDSEGGIDSVETVGSAEIKSNKFHFSDRHILFGKLRPYLRKIARPDFSGICSTDIIPILPKEGLSRDYLFHFLRTPEAVELATSRSSGANLPRLSPKQLATFQIPLPRLAEQKRIARILDAADALRAKRRESLASTESLLQSTFLDIFGDPVTNPMGWEVTRIGSIIKVLGGFAFKSADFAEEGVPIVRISNLAGDSINLENCARIPVSALGKGARFKLYPGDTLMAMSGATTGKLGHVPDELNDDWYLNQRVGAFRVPQGAAVDRQYLRALLKSSFYQDHVWNLAGGAAQPNISGKQLESAEIPVPPLDLQHRFAAMVEALEQQKVLQRAHLAELDTLFASLQARAFRGDL